MSEAKVPNECHGGGRSSRASSSRSSLGPHVEEAADGDKPGEGYTEDVDDFVVEDMDDDFMEGDDDFGDDDVADEVLDRDDDDNKTAKTRCKRIKGGLQREWHEIRRNCSKVNWRGSARRLFSVDTLKRRLPILTWGPKYSLADLQGDLIAGFTIGLTVLPQSIAYASMAGVPAQCGLYSSFFGSFIYMIFGSAKDICLGPSAISSLLTAIYATSPVMHDVTYAQLLTLFSGIIQMAMFLFGFGFLMDFVSLPLIKAFTSACAITIAMSQVKKWWGLQNVPRDFLPQLRETLMKLPQTRLWDFLLGVCCIFIILALKQLKEMKWRSRFHELPLYKKILKKTLWAFGTARNVVVIILATAASYIFLENGLSPFSITGYIPPGIPPFVPPPFAVTDPKTNHTYNLSDISQSIGLGFIIVPLIGLVEAMAIGNVFARKFNYRIDANQELLAYGIGNVLTSFVGGYTITGTFSRTALNAQSGVRTPAGGVVTGLIVLLSLQFLTPAFKYIPDASLAVVIILAVVDMITFHKVWTFWKTRKIDLIPWLVTFVLSLVLNIAYGVIIGAGLSVLLLLYPVSRPRIKVIDKETRSFFRCHHLKKENGQFVVVEFNAGLMYPTMEYLKDKVIPLYGRDVLPKGVVLNLEHVSVVDSTTVQGFRVLLENFNRKGIMLVVCNLQKPVESILIRSKMKFFRKAPSVSDAVKLIYGISPSSSATDSTCFCALDVEACLAEITFGTRHPENGGVPETDALSYGEKSSCCPDTAADHLQTSMREEISAVIIQNDLDVEEEGGRTWMCAAPCG